MGIQFQRIKRFSTSLCLVAVCALILQPAYVLVAGATSAAAKGQLTLLVEPRTPEKVTLSFDGTGTLELAGYKLYDTLASKTLRATFLPEHTLAGGQSLTLCNSGCDVAVANNIWNDSGDTAVLENAEAQAVVSVSYASGATSATGVAMIDLTVLGEDEEPPVIPENPETPP